jgi:hypothetical protein
LTLQVLWCVFLKYSNNEKRYFRRYIKRKFRLDYDFLDINLDYRNGDSQVRLDNQDESELYLSGIIFYQNSDEHLDAKNDIPTNAL